MEFVQPIRDKQKLDAMKTYLRGKSLRDYCLFVLGINSGLRVSDLLSLTVSSVTKSSGTIADRVAIRESKTGKLKDFPLNTSCKRALSEYLSTRSGAKSDDPLFPSQKGGSLGRIRAYELLNAAARAVGIEDQIGTHTLRKTFGYHNYQSGLDLSLIQKLMNHASPSITLRYIGITQDQLDDAYLNLNL